MKNREMSLCPYPGLRPFNEKEAIFFKGRERNITEIINQLEQKRFVVITGASGDGKSSIVYAGVIPDIKAGFIKATYNAWKFSIIKPEDKPLLNLSRSLAGIFKLSLEKVAEDLSYGFSSIVDLYKSSEYFIDTTASEWQDSSLEEKKARRAKAANLFILIDQFEEFFTNAENFYNGEPTLEAETTINLLVETVRLANEQNLPIYIVLTMRSDFIGNSPSFRGLPELIGFSHFFIPRLNREEIEKVILEPALLNGDSISDKLVNYLSSAATEGADQLPIIQHALNRIWNMAKKRNEEMGMIHLAMSGGIDPAELVDEEKEGFRTFFQNVSTDKKIYFSNPSLQNVLNAHADELMEDTVAELEKSGGVESDKAILYIALKRSFQTLTKIDNNRAVRHRSTVNELLVNINISTIGLKEINVLLRKYREPGNTLLYPFVNQEEELTGDSVLDITHEALIRNWDKLRDWSEEDNRNLNEYIDFNKQLLSWKNNNQSDSFLLPLGPLEQFEQWHKQSFINEYWIVKYDDSTDDESQKKIKAREQIQEIHFYLKESRKHLNKIESAKKARNKIIIAASVFAVLVLSGLTIWAFSQKNYASVQQTLAEKKRKEAEFLKQLAVETKDEAKAAEALARKNEQDAIKARSESDISARNALAQKEIAQKATALSQSKTELANNEAKRANSEANNANRQKIIAEEATQNALQSESKTKVLSIKALSQKIAYMATEKYEEEQMPALLSMHAWDLHKEVNGETLDPVIYNGLVQASYYLNGKNCFDFRQTSDAEQVVVKELGNDKLLSIGMDGIGYELNKYTNEAKRSDYNFNCINCKSAIKSVFSENKSALVFVEYNSGSVWVFSLKSDKKEPLYQFDNFSSDIRGAMQIGNGEKFLLISKKGKVFTYNKTDKQPEQVTELNEDIISFVSLNGNSCLIGTAKGNIYLYTVGAEKKLLYANTKQKQLPYCMEADNTFQNVFVGFSDGRVIKFEFSANSMVVKNEYKISKALIKKMSFSENSSILAVVSSDNKVWMIDLKQKQNKPASVSFSYSVKALYADNTGTVFASLSDLTLKKLYSDCDMIYKKLCNTIKRDLTFEEWNEMVSDEIKFQPLNCKK